MTGAFRQSLGSRKWDGWSSSVIALHGDAGATMVEFEGWTRINLHSVTVIASRNQIPSPPSLLGSEIAPQINPIQAQVLKVHCRQILLWGFFFKWNVSSSWKSHSVPRELKSWNSPVSSAPSHFCLQQGEQPWHWSHCSFTVFTGPLYNLPVKSPVLNPKCTWTELHFLPGFCQVLSPRDYFL